MTRARAIKIRWRGEASHHSAAADLLTAPGDAALVQRGRPRWLLVRCPCGCNDTISLNVDAGAGPAWRLYAAGAGMSVFPSVWKESGCLSHFIIWRGRIDWLEFDLDEGISEELKADVRRLLSKAEYISYLDVAEQLSAIPWDVLQACRELVREGAAMELPGKQRGKFRLR